MFRQRESLLDATDLEKPSKFLSPTSLKSALRQQVHNQMPAVDEGEDNHSG